MKAFILLLAIALVYCDSTGSYREVNLQELEKDNIMKELLEYGVAQFMLKESTVRGTDYPSLNILHVGTQVVNGMNYKFDVELAGIQGNPLYVTLIVYYQPWTKTKELTSYTVHDGMQQF